MNRLKFARFCLIIFMVFLPSNSLGAEFWYVERQALNCVQRQISEYQKVETKLIVVFFADCPNTDLAGILLNKTENTSILPEIEDGQGEPDSSSPSEVITLTRQQLECLASYVPTESVGAIIKLPKKICP